MIQFILFMSTFVFSFIVIYFVLRIAKRFALYDRIDERKVHSGNVPRLGGVGIFFAFIVSVLGAGWISGQFYPGKIMVLLLSSCVLIFVMGVWDDMKPWRARYKLLIQCIASVLVIFAGFRCQSNFVLVQGIELNIGIFSIPLTFFWIIGVTNALNLIDGIDGLAGTIATLALLAYAVIFYWCSNIEAMIICLFLVAAICGFLVYNLPFPKARIFMGDGGSQFLGFVLAVLPFFPNTFGTVDIALPYAFALLIIPIFDTFAAIWRRLREKRRFDSPDKLHLHHKLMMMGFSARQALLLLFFLQLIIGLLVLISISIHGWLSRFLLVGIYCIGILFFTVVHVRKEEILEKSKNL